MKLKLIVLILEFALIFLEIVNEIIEIILKNNLL